MDFCCVVERNRRVSALYQKAYFGASQNNALRSTISQGCDDIEIDRF